MVSKALAILLFATSLARGATTWYVDADAAAGSNSGTSWANAWTNMGDIVYASLAAGDTVYISGGTYGGTLDGGNWSIRPTKSGSAGSPITFKASQEAGHADAILFTNWVNMGYANYITFDGAKSDAYAASYVTNTWQTTNVLANCNIRILGRGPFFYGGAGAGIQGWNAKWVACECDNPTPTAISAGVAFNVSSTTYTNNVFEYLYFTNLNYHVFSQKTGSGEPNTTIARFCHAVQTTADGAEVVPGWTFHNNYFDGSDLDGDHNDGLSGPVSNISYYNNIVRSWKERYFYPVIIGSNSHSLYVYGNLFFNSGVSNITHNTEIIASFAQEAVGEGALAWTNSYWTNIVFANNTLVADANTAANGWVPACFQLANRYATTNIINLIGWTIKNNLFINSYAAAVNLKDGKGVYGAASDDGFYYATNDFVFDYNAIYSTIANGNIVRYYGTNYTNAATFAAATGFSSNKFYLPVVFENQAAYDYRLSATDTTARNSGEDLSALNLPGWGVDLNGNVRTNDAAVDIGALEFVQPDSSLLVHLTFENNFETDGYVADVSGNARHAWRFGKPGTSYPSNSITPISVTAAAPGLSASFGNAGLFRWGTNDWGLFHKSGSYAAITNNMDALTNMATATIALWFKTDHWSNIVGAGDYSADGNAALLASSPSTGIGGNWLLGRINAYSSQAQLRFAVMTNSITEPSYCWVDFPGAYIPKCDSTNWHHAAVVWNGGYFTNYWDGAAVDSAYAPTVSTLKITQNFPGTTKWIGVGVLPHGGSPPLEDETGEDYPNNGWFNGKLDDVRIYDRVLSPSEIASLYLTGVSRKVRAGSLRVGVMRGR